MNNKTVEAYLRKMLEIDQQAVDTESRVKDEEELKQKELRKAKRELEMDILKRARMESRKEQEAILKEAREQESALQGETEAELSALRSVYAEAEPRLLDEIMGKMLTLGPRS